MWTESPEHSEWGADILNELIAALPSNIRIGLHVCGGNPRRKARLFHEIHGPGARVRKLKIHEVSLEHCTLSYDLMTLWPLWSFKGDLALGVIDQRSDEIETLDVIRKRIEPAPDSISRANAHLTSDAALVHVPLDITHKKTADAR